MYTLIKNKLTVARVGQITIVYTIGLMMYLFTTIPHSWWIFVTVLMMSAAMEPGLVIQKSVNRGKGTLMGIILFIPLIYLLQLDYRFIPLVLILACCFINVPSAKRYDLSVVAMTIMVLTLTAYTFNKSIIAGPIVEGLNRAICTMIGIFICIGGDYFLFSRFKYSKKVYYVLQHELCNLLEEQLLLIQDFHQKHMNAVILVDKIRERLNGKFSELNTSGNSLLFDMKIDNKTKNMVKHFDEIAWYLRREVYAVFYCTSILEDKAASVIHLARFQELLIQAKDSIIKL